MSSTDQESPDFRQTVPLTGEQRFALVSTLRELLQQHTYGPAEGAWITMVVAAGFCMDIRNNDIEAMAGSLQELERLVVDAFRQGILGMQRQTVQ